MTEEDKTFDQFYAKLSDIVNFIFNLGEKIEEKKDCQENFRSLPSRFDSKVDIIEENKNLDNVEVNQLVGNIQTFEVNRLNKENFKDKGIALKAIKESTKKSDKKIETDSDTEPKDDIIELMKCFKKYMKS